MRARIRLGVMAERRRSAHAIDDQNNGGRSQQGTQERKRRPMAGFITLLQNCILFKSTCPLEGAALCSWRVVHSRLAKPILPIVNPEISTRAWFFLLICIHIGYWKFLSFVGIEKSLGNFFY